MRVNRDRVLELLRQSFTAEELENWSASLGLSVEDGVLTVRFPHRFFADWFEKNARRRFETALAGTGLEVVYVGSDGRVESCPMSPLPVSTPYGREFVFENFLANDKNIQLIGISRQRDQRTIGGYRIWVDGPMRTS